MHVTPAIATGPIHGGRRGRPFASSIVDLDPYGAVEEEFFVTGTATPFLPAEATPLPADGRWHVEPGETAPYCTRIVVRRPPADRFNGTVVVEFLQEYFGTERDTNFRWNAETFLREGFAWVGASLHHEGVDARDREPTRYGDLEIPTGPSLVEWDPDRYADLRLPHSDLCYDLLSQIGLAVGARRSGPVDPLGGLAVERVVAAGNTIAATRLRHYINAVHPRHRVYDGFYLQDLTDDDIALSDGAAPVPAAWVRTDVTEPVIVLNTTTAACDSTIQPEGPNLRFWEPAGSSHTTGPYMVRVAEATLRDLGADTPVCPPEYANTLPVQYVSGAAFVALHHWIRSGVAAPSFPRLTRTGPVPKSDTDFDDLGNVAGGLRTPWVDVPIARYDWRGECLGGAGRTFPFSNEQLADLYGTPAEYRRRFAESAAQAVAAGVLLPHDATTAIEETERVTW